jgi:hypothetical protein
VAEVDARAVLSGTVGAAILLGGCSGPAAGRPLIRDA